MKHILLTTAALALLSGAVMAQTTPGVMAPATPAATSPAVTTPVPIATNSNSGQPIEITATKTVEWLRNNKQYVARENVVVTQGTMSISTDLLTADYHETAQSSTDIWQLTAEGNVQIKDTNNTAYGDKGVYDVPSGVATLTGSNLKLVSPDQTVTARDKMEYHSNERMAKAIGNAKVVRAQDTLTADVITAYFKDNNAAPAPTPTTAPATTEVKPAANTGNLDHIEADGKVVIITPTEKLYGNKGTYQASTNTAQLIGNVKIERGENVLEGERAEVNLTTNISKMFSSNKPGGRVRGVFFPGAEKGTDKKGQDKSPIPAPFKAPATAPLAAPVIAPVSPTTTAPAIVVPAPVATTPVPAATSPVSPSTPATATTDSTAPDLFPAAPETGKVSPQVKY